MVLKFDSLTIHLDLSFSVYVHMYKYRVPLALPIEMRMAAPDLIVFSIYKVANGVDSRLLNSLCFWPQQFSVRRSKINFV